MDSCGSPLAGSAHILVTVAPIEGFCIQTELDTLGSIRIDLKWSK
jgi:hypothetical protein